MTQITNILVLDANQRSALAVTRSLGQHKDLRVFTADSINDALAGHSRFSQRYYQYPSPHQSPASFCAWLKQFVHEQSIDWVFPCTEVSSQTILSVRDELAPCQIPFANIDTVMQLADKWRLVTLAAQLEIPHPATQHFSSSSSVDISQVKNYPVVIKPCLSRIRTASGWLDTGVHIVENRQALEQILSEKIYLLNHPFMLQEFIPGHGAGIFALYNQGNPVAFFAHRRLREKPPRGGVSTLSESVEPDSLMLSIAEKLLNATHWHGVAMVEFRVDPQGTPYLMEVNTRFWGSLQLSIDAGVDFPWLLYQISMGRDVATVNKYKIGQRLRWLLGDVDSLYLTLRDSQFSRSAKIKRLLDFLTPHFFRTRHEVNRLSDLKPFWYELKYFVSHLLR